jgi:hypothetical protein
VSSPRVSRSVRVANPLSTIAVFLAFAEVTSGVAATLTVGGVQIAFTVFSLAFPVVVAAGFGVFLWKKPEVLYAPGDFSKDTPIHAFVEATRGHGLQASLGSQTAAFREIVESAVESTIEKYRPAADADGDAGALARTVAEQEILKRTIVVDLPGEESAGPFIVPVGVGTTVDDFLNTVYFALDGLVPPYTYGATWVLVDPVTGRELADVGSMAVRGRVVEQDDNRPLAEAGIEPGSRLVVRLLGHWAQARL